MAVIEERKSGEGKTVYRVKIRLRGAPQQTATFRRKTDAKLWAEETETAIRQGKYFRQAEAKKHTVSELIERYLEHLPGRKIAAHHLRNREIQLEWWKNELGYLLLSDVTPPLLASCREKLLKETTSRLTPRSSATANRYFAALSQAFTTAVEEWGWLEENPCRRVKRAKEPRGRVRFLSDDERTRLLEACQENKSKHLHLIVVLALSSGMRKGEILNLTWDQIDFKKRRIILEQTKNDERRSIPLVGRAFELMSEYGKVRRLDTNLLFPSKTDPEKPIDIRKPWLAALEKAEISDFRFHDLRHSAASYLAMNGATVPELAEILGHKTLQMVKRYAHLTDSHTAQVVSRMNEEIFG